MIALSIACLRGVQVVRGARSYQSPLTHNCAPVCGLVPHSQERLIFPDDGYQSVGFSAVVMRRNQHILAGQDIDGSPRPRIVPELAKAAMEDLDRMGQCGSNRIATADTIRSPGEPFNDKSTGGING